MGGRVRNGPCPVPRKPPPESSVPGETLTGGSRRNQLRREHGSPPVLSEVPHELSIPMRTPKSANGPRSNSFRPDSPSTTNLPRGRKTHIPPIIPSAGRTGGVLTCLIKSGRLLFTGISCKIEYSTFWEDFYIWKKKCA